jgi:hypothetical protein
MHHIYPSAIRPSHAIRELDTVKLHLQAVAGTVRAYKSCPRDHISQTTLPRHPVGPWSHLASYRCLHESSHSRRLSMGHSAAIAIVLLLPCQRYAQYEIRSMHSPLFYYCNRNNSVCGYIDGARMSYFNMTSFEANTP